MREVMRSYFGEFPLAADGPVLTERLQSRLRVRVGVLTAVLCAAFLFAGCPWPAIACALSVVFAIGYGPELTQKARNVAAKCKRTTGASVAAMLCCTMLLGATVGCGQKQVKDVVYLIGIESQQALPLIAVLTNVAAVVLPAEAPLVVAIGATAQASIAVISKLCLDYAAAPSDDIWNSLVAAINKLVTDGSGALLDAGHITNPASRLEVEAALGALQTVLLIIDGFVQQARTKAQNKIAAQARVIKLRQIEQYLDHRQIEEATGHSFGVVYEYETSLGY